MGGLFLLRSAPRLPDYLEQARRNNRKPCRERQRYWGGRECDEYIISTDGWAMYSAYVAGARDIVQARLERVADFIVGPGTRRTASGSWCVYCEELEEKFGVTIQEGNGLDAMLKDTLERRPEVAQVEIALQHIETTFHPEFCAQLHTAEAEKTPDIRLRDILPLLKGGGMTFLTHEEADTSVLAEHLDRLTDTGREDSAALFNARGRRSAPVPRAPRWCSPIWTPRSCPGSTGRWKPLSRRSGPWET